jgi:predicted nuclease of predicted toxin-antitoxin system
VQPIKLLLDENLSPAIGVRLRNDGVDVAHVRDRGLIEAEFAAGHDMVNRVLRINLAGDKTFETVPPSQP